MKNLIVGMLTLAILSGCALFSKTATEQQKANQIYLLSKDAANIGTQAALVEKPKLRPQFETAWSNLVVLTAQTNVPLTDLNSLLSTLPVKELKSQKAQLVIGAATLLFDSTVGSQVDISKAQPYVNAAATGVRDGMGTALGH